MTRLVDILNSSPEPAEALQRAVDAGEIVAPGFVHPFLLAAVLAHEPWPSAPALVVVPSESDVPETAEEVAGFLPGRRVLQMPSRGVWYGSEVAVSPRVAAQRHEALMGIGVGGAVLVAAAATLMEGVREVPDRPAVIRAGEEYGFDRLLEALADLGYERVEQVEEVGEFSVRGGIVDVFPGNSGSPYRAEFWGDEVESLRRFSVFTQRSLGAEEVAEIPAAREAEGAPVTMMAHMLPDSVRIVWVDPDGAEPHVQEFAADLEDVLGGESDGAVGECYASWTEVTGGLDTFPTVRIRPPAGARAEPVVRALSGDLPVGSTREAEAELRRLVEQGYRVVVSFSSRAEAERAEYVLDGAGGRAGRPDQIPGGPGVTYVAGGHRRHFLVPEMRVALLTDRQILPRRRRRPRERRLSVGAEIASFRDLRRDDYVVHEDQGIGRFVGLSTKTVGGITRDYLDIVFRDGDMLFVPHEQIDKVSRYVASGTGAPSLSKLGGKGWEHVKARTRQAVRELAGELLRLYALREASSGEPAPADDEWQQKFEQAFPYHETEDQLEAIDAVKEDMEQPRPMDRLVCGDVGYGKTEVALRAAFKAVTGGRQVLVLVPTTILAQQHHGTFRERLAEFPVKVEMLSRFRTAREQKRILREFANGDIDVLVGTHRLLSEDVSPDKLGLVIVDEEQRFGVAQKEALRQLKLQVDVLTLSATPIPRTLQMSLSGVRDISVIETPPRDRHPVQTYVGVLDEDMIRRAVEREIARGGQVFYLHNRVETIDRAAERLRGLLPDVRIAMAHGQQEEQALEQVMLEFLRGEHDVLVSTTIIESGLDIPNANTLIVERADLLGLAQLYQIRGRIGRSSRVAHAFLFHPGDEVLTREARERLATLSDYTELGSGFKIAMRDLEIRGAGDLLGDEQSGHVAAVGFDMYLRMLSDTVELMQGGGEPRDKMPRVEVGISAYVPSDYIGYESARVDIHRRIASAADRERLDDLRTELEDRFGPLPEPVENLVFLGEVRCALEELGARSLSVRGGKVRISGLELPSGSREALRRLDQRYVYAPATGELTLGFRGSDSTVRDVVQRVLSDILPLRFGETHAVA